MNLEIFSKENSLSVATLQSQRNTIPAATARVPAQAVFTADTYFSCGFIYLLCQSISLLGELTTIQHNISLADWLTPDQYKDLKLNCREYDLP